MYNVGAAAPGCAPAHCIAISLVLLQPATAPPRLPLPAPQVIKRTGVQMQQRQVQAAAIASWQNKVEKLEPQVGFQCFCMACMACKAKAQAVVPCSVEARPG